MLGSRLAHCSRSVASTSAAPVACLHSSAALQASSFRGRKSRIAEKANVDRRAERERLGQLNRPHVVLGNKPGDEAKWTNCDLAKVIITEQDVISASIPSTSASQNGQIQLPKYFNYGVGEREREMLFETLPVLTAEAVLLRASFQEMHQPGWVEDTSTRAEKIQLYKASVLASLVDLRNANAGGFAYENRRRIVAAFSEPEKPNDTGRPEVQAAILTHQIRNMWDHLGKYKKDASNRRSLRRLVHQRAKILKYLKGIDRDRYDRVLGRCGLEPESVEGELVV